jgi:hypothetical protein
VAAGASALWRKNAKYDTADATATAIRIVGRRDGVRTSGAASMNSPLSLSETRQEYDREAAVVKDKS